MPRTLRALAAITLVLAACGDTTGSTHVTTPPATAATTVPDTSTTQPPSTTSEPPASPLEAARARWQAAGITTYWFEAMGSVSPVYECDTDGVFVVQVAGSEPVTAVNKLLRCELDVASSRFPLTVEALFDLADRSSAADVRFHPDLGYPTSIALEQDGDPIVELGVSELARGLYDTAQQEQIEADVAAAEELWESQGPANYTYVLEILCFCPREMSGPFKVIVRAAAPPEVFLDGAPAPIGIQSRSEFLSVPGLFGFVRDNALADNINVTYDPDLGFPTQIEVDSVFSVVDEEVTVVISGLRADD